MDRRTFISKSTAAGLLPLVPAGAYTQDPKNQLIKPRPLPKNGTVTLVTPASPISRSSFEKALQNLSDLGLQVKYSPNVRVRSGFLSGTDAQRVADLHSAFADESSDAVICLRGGYGSGRILPLLDYDLIRRSRKIFCGFSDITAVLAALSIKTGLVCFHGPVAASEFTPSTAESFFEVLQKGKKLKLKNDDSAPLASGVATGSMVGGNLSILCSLIGTPYDPDYSGQLLFLEEVGESTYRIDRMLTQLLHAGKLKNVKGIILGQFTGCDTSHEDPSYEYSLSLEEVFLDRFSSLGIPVANGFSIGHEKENATIPVGLAAELDADKGILHFLESAVED